LGTNNFVLRTTHNPITFRISAIWKQHYYIKTDKKTPTQTLPYVSM